jgi:hypothetical protein
MAAETRENNKDFWGGVMRDDVQCPYCDANQEICHDDGYGYEEDRIHQQECDCGKTFAYTTSISFYYESFLAPCMNGGEHKWEKIVGVQKEFFKDKYRCEYCEEEKTIKENKG